MGAQEGESKVPETYQLCQLFRRLAARSLDLPATGDPSDQPERTRLIEDVLEVCNELDVWVDGTVEECCKAVVALYDNRADDAAEIFNAQADYQLKCLREDSPTS